MISPRWSVLYDAAFESELEFPALFFFFLNEAVRFTAFTLKVFFPLSITRRREEEEGEEGEGKDNSHTQR